MFYKGLSSYNQHLWLYAYIIDFSENVNQMLSNTSVQK
jgi:hypothetical protein